ncbi:maker65 [Drosophila busckii]|uniref:Maker65 n=2 Tax=Drosophila busckii TaxID=30019 RepID=A0A0M4EG90_DROBS|nr:maker65 [Drosophila busckii]
MLGAAQFYALLAIISIFSSQLLYLGVKLQRKFCLLLWLYVSIVFALAFCFYTLFIAYAPRMLILHCIAILLLAYFMLIVLSYYLQLERAEDSPDMEVLFSATAV